MITPTFAPAFTKTSYLKGERLPEAAHHRQQDAPCEAEDSRMVHLIGTVYST
jgi:hypothetical protein